LKSVVLLLLLVFTTVQAQTPKPPTIAYVRNGTEIRLIEPDGANDRRLWTHPDASAELGISSVAWRPDRKELAFSSGHAKDLEADLWIVGTDGRNARLLVRNGFEPSW
jgi:dipeptidyl aminopeptidase/acylaminoacyl peptidase